MSDSEQDIIDMIKQLGPEPPMNEDHRQRLREKVLNAYDERTVLSVQKHQPPVSYSQGVTLMRITASVAILAIIGFFAGSMLNPSRLLAFENVARTILRIKNVSFEIHANQEKGECIMQANGKMRLTMRSGEVYIADPAVDKILMIDPTLKVASLTEGLLEADVPDVFLTDIQDHLRRAEQSKDFGEIQYEKLGEQKIDGKRAIGYRVSDPGDADFDWFDIWADVETALPIQLDYAVTVNGTTVVSTMKKFLYNQELDPKLFSLEVPEGFKLERGTIEGPATFEDLANSLRMYAEHMDGNFPPSLTKEVMANAYAKAINKVLAKVDPDQLLKAETETLIQRELPNLDRMLFSLDFIDELKDEGAAYTYAGQKVKLGDKDRPVFWYQPKDSDAFRVLYGDLSIRQVEKAPVER